MRVQFVTRGVSGGTGTGRYARGVQPRLRAFGIDVVPTAPTPSPAVANIARFGRRFGVDLATFFGSYPIAIPRVDADVTHVTSQTMATLLLRGRDNRPTVVTALDIIPLLVADDPELRAFGHPIDAICYRIAMIGLRRADRVLAISHHTRETLIDVLRIPGDRIDVTHLGVDRTLFRPGAPSARATYGLPRDVPIAVYVGSDDPRKDLATLIRSLATDTGRQARFHALIVGPRQFAGQHEKLRQLIARLDVRDRVTFLEGLPDDDVVGLLNLATCFVTPSLYEGFGLPALEAMACGTAVIYADATASREIVGEAGVAFPPRDAKRLARSIASLADDESLRAALRERGLARSAEFTWERTAEMTVAAYGRALGDARRGSMA